MATWAMIPVQNYQHDSSSWVLLFSPCKMLLLKNRCFQITVAFQGSNFEARWTSFLKAFCRNILVVFLLFFGLKEQDMTEDHISLCESQKVAQSLQHLSNYWKPKFRLQWITFVKSCVKLLRNFWNHIFELRKIVIIFAFLWILGIMKNVIFVLQGVFK